MDIDEVLRQEWSTLIRKIKDGVPPEDVPDVINHMVRLMDTELGTELIAFSINDLIQQTSDHSVFQPVIPYLLKAIESGENVAQSGLALGFLHATEAIPHLVNYLDKDEQVASSSLKRIGEPAIPAILEVLYDEQRTPYIRGYVLNMVIYLDDERITKAAIDFLHGENAELGEDATRALKTLTWRNKENLSLLSRIADELTLEQSRTTDERQWQVNETLNIIRNYLK